MALALAGCAAEPAPGHATAAAAAGAAHELAAELAARPESAAGRRVAVMPPRTEPPALVPLARDLRHRLGDQLRRALPEIVLVERDDLEALWQEHRLPASGLLDTRTTSALGRLLGAEALVVGELLEVGGNLQLHVRLIDVETAEILASATRPLAIAPPPGAAAASTRGSAAVAAELGGGADRAASPDASGLSGSALSGGPTTAAEPAPPRADAAGPPPSGRRVVGDFRLALEGCGFLADQLVCRLRIHNLAPGPRTLTLLGDSLLHDTHGEGYRLQRVRIGTQVSDLETAAAAARHQLPGGLAAAAELTFSGVPRRKKKAQLLDLRFAEGRSTFTDIPLARD